VDVRGVVVNVIKPAPEEGAVNFVSLLGRAYKWLRESLDSRDHANARKWARDILSRNDWVILDTETTGLANTSEVIQIGVLAPDGSTLMDQLCRPIGRIGAKATEIHGITSQDVRSAPRYVEVHSTLKELVRGKTVIAYNAVFDSRLLRQTAEKHGTDQLGAIWDCCMVQYNQFVGEQRSTGGYRYQKLPRGDQHAELHGAIGDCRLTLEVIRLMAR
jgi:DNA polymerase-3 subunit epsilon